MSGFTSPHPYFGIGDFSGTSIPGCDMMKAMRVPWNVKGIHTPLKDPVMCSFPNWMIAKAISVRGYHSLSVLLYQFMVVTNES